MSDLETSNDSLDSLDSELYEISPYPNNTKDKVGITIKGSSEAYINAHKIVSDIMSGKGDRYEINGVEIAILDAPKNKSISVEVKSRRGLSGKANIKIYGVNKGGFATLMVTKPKGIQYEYSKILALKVIKFLMDGLIDESMSVKDIQEMKSKKNCDKKKIGNQQCDSCDKKFANAQGLQLHKTRVHKKKTTVECELSEKVLEDIEQLKSHRVSEQGINLEKIEELEVMEFEENTEIEENFFKMLETISWEENRLFFIEKRKDSDNEMDIDEETKKREKFQDEKIMRKQKKLEEEEIKYKKEKEKREEEMKEDEKKRKRQASIEKKKGKKKTKKEEKSTENNPKVKSIDKKYDALFSALGLNPEEFCTYVTQGDGACGANCVAILYHHEEKLGQYVRRNVNEHKVKFWQFYKDFYAFPITQSIGNNQISFNDEEEYLNFLKNDPKSSFVWMEHLDLQAISTMYQVPVHILTTGVQGMKEPAARWTHLEPDNRVIQAGSELQKFGKLPELWILHKDEIHYSLIIKKESILAKEGSVEFRKEKEGNESTESTTNIDNGSLSDKNVDFESGPGYMGWKIPDNSKKYQEEKLFLDKVSDVKACYEELKKNFLELKSDFETMKTKMDEKKNLKVNDDRAINLLKIEVSKLKEDYKDCVKAIKDETFARNKAEEEVKVLKATLKALDDLKQPEIDIDQVDSEKMETGEESEALEPDLTTANCKTCNEKYKNVCDLKIHMRDSHEQQQKSCSLCKLVFKNAGELEIHMATHTTESLGCNICQIKFNNESDRINHLKIHVEDGPYTCDLCENLFKDQKSLSDHAQEHVSNNSTDGKKSRNMPGLIAQVKEHEEKHEQKKFICCKCEKVYSSMSQLRRHDWRSHRAVNCNICDDRIESREQIGDHRKSKHQLFKKTICRFYPQCLDGEECLFAHEQIKSVKNGTFLCPMGRTCSDQSCKFSEANHKNENEILCKFQAQCNRKFCPFQHSVARIGFLENVSPIKNQM